jgi:hypothetical protein
LADGTEFRCGAPIAVMCVSELVLAGVVVRRGDGATA